VVYLKNRVTRGWAPGEEYPNNKQIPEEEKIDLRNRLLPVLASSPPQIRSQLIPILQKILHYDFPGQWPNFMDITVQLLNTNDGNTVFAGLNCMLAICRVYRFKGAENRGDFNQIVQASFPQMLGIGTRLVNEDSLEAWEMLRILLKAYKHAIYVSLLYHRLLLRRT
jgi:importin-7